MDDQAAAENDSQSEPRGHGNLIAKGEIPDDDDFIELLHVYPTMAEALKIGAISRFKDPAKLSCCAE